MNGHATLVIDPYNGISVVVTDEWGAVMWRSDMHQSIEQAIIDAARYLGRPLTLELRQLK